LEAARRARANAFLLNALILVGWTTKRFLGHIDELIKTEHGLRTRLAAGELTTDQEQAELKAAEEALDQCWDLLRQRRARRGVLRGSGRREGAAGP